MSVMLDFFGEYYSHFAYQVIIDDVAQSESMKWRKSQYISYAVEEMSGSTRDHNALVQGCLKYGVQELLQQISD